MTGQSVPLYAESVSRRVGVLVVWFSLMGVPAWAAPAVSSGAGAAGGVVSWAASGAAWGGWLASAALLIVCGIWRSRVRREEQRRKQAENLLQRVADIVPSPLLVKDAQGRFLLINSAYTDAYGTDASACLGKTLPEVDNFMTQEKRQELHNRDMEHIREGGSRSVASEAVYATGEVRQGQYQASVFPMEDEKQQPGLIIFFSDHTESLRLIRELHNVNRLSSVALELAKAGDWRLTPEKNGDFIVSELGRAILGDSPTEGDPCLWRMQDWKDAVAAADPEQAQHAAQSYSGALEGTAPVYDETYRFRRPMDGQMIWVHDRGIFEHDAVNVATASQGVIQDITMFKQAEDDARESRLTLEREAKTRREFLINMGHELRTPMNGILGMSHLVLQGELPPAQQGYVRAIEVSGQILLRILNDILEYATLKDAALSFERVDFPPKQMLEHVLAPLAVQAEEKGVAFHMYLDDALPTMITGDSDRLGQILTSLVDNAIKSAEGGEVITRVDVAEVDADESRVALRFSVHSSGISLSENELRQLFVPFSQSDGTSSRYGGTRLGLAISKQLVEMQGGALEAVNEPGEGNTFVFTLSFALPALKERVEQPSLTRQAMLQVLKGANVLLVEDNEINQIVVNDILTRLGVRVRIAEDGMQAVEMVRDGDYDVVLMDIQMPVMDGFEATQLLRAEPRFANLPIIALTAHAMPEDRQRSLTGGMSDHLTKPIDPEALLATLARWLLSK